MRLIGAPAFTSRPPPSMKIRLEKSTLASRVCVCVVLAHSSSARPPATICSRSATGAASQLIFSSGSPTARAICATTRLHRSIE